MAAAGLVLLTGCKDDNESNPTIAQPSQFVLNEPAVKDNVDLQKSSKVALTWSQPTPYNNFNAPMVPTYTIQVSPTLRTTRVPTSLSLPRPIALVRMQRSVQRR